MDRSRIQLRRLVLALTLAGAASASADPICPTAANPCVVSTDVVVAPGTIDHPDRDILVKMGKTVSVSGGDLTLNAKSLVLEPGAHIEAFGVGGTGAALSITTSGDITLQSATNRSRIDVSADSQGGTILLDAGGDVGIDGVLDARGDASDGSGGGVTVVAQGDVTLTGTQPILASGGAQGFGGAASVTAAGGTLTANGPIDVSGGDCYPCEIDLSAGTDVVTGSSARLDVGATGPEGDGGTVAVLANGDATLNGRVNAPAAGNDTLGSGTGGNLSVLIGGTIRLVGQVDLTGAAPGGTGGFADLESDTGDVFQSGPLSIQGRGADGCGGGLLATGVNLTFGDVDVHGGSCAGGSIAVTADGTVTFGGEINADAPGDAGTASVSGLAVSVTGNVHADSDPAGSGGLLVLHGCSVSVPLGGEVSARGAVPGATVLLQSNGDLVVGGTLAAGVENRLEYASAATPPVIAAGTSVVPAAHKVLVPNLDPCVGPPPPPSTTTSTTTTTTTTTTLSTTTTTTTLTTVTVPTTTSTTKPATTTTTTAPTTTPTTTATTTTATTTRPPTTTTTTTTTAAATTSTTRPTTTTTTLAPAACDPAVPLACDDGDPCTADACVDLKCANVQVVRPVAVTCRLDGVDALLASTAATDLGGTKAQGKLKGRVADVRRAFALALKANGRRALRALRRTRTQLDGFVRAVQRNRKIAAKVSERLVLLAGQASTEIGPLEDRTRASARAAAHR